MNKSKVKSQKLKVFLILGLLVAGAAWFGAPKEAKAVSCSSAGPDGDTVYTSAGTRRTYIYGASGDTTQAVIGVYPSSSNDWIWYYLSGYPGNITHDVSMSGLQAGGTNFVSTYVRDGAGNWSNRCGYNTFYLRVPPAPSLSSVYPQASSTTATSGSFRISATGVSNVDAMYFPTWSEVSGQDDIVWYSGSNDGGGNWHADLNLASHPGLGSIITHVYGRSSYTGALSFLGNTSFQRVAPPPTASISISPSSIAYNGSATISWSSTNATSCTAQGDPASWQGGIATSGSQTGNFTQSATYRISCSGPGGTSSQASATLTVAAPPAPTADIRINNSNGPVYINYNTSATLSWSSSNATSCTAQGDPSSWQGGIATSGSQTGNFTASATYRIACTGPGGTATDSVVLNINPQPACSSAGPDGVSVAYNASHTVYAYGVSNASAVNFPTWSDTNGQDDVVWYSGSNQGSGTWAATIDFNRHSGSGAYNVHVYLYNGNYSNVWCDTANFTRQNPPSPSLSSVSPESSTTTATSGSFRISATGVSNTDAMYFPTWSEVSGQDDVVWYPVDNNGGGNWSQYINLESHPGLGSIITHVYGRSLYTGSWSLIGNTSFQRVQPAPPSCTSSGPSGDTTSATSGTRRANAYGVVNASEVYFPTWSDPGWQDDVVWYPGTNAGGGTWYADANLASHPGLGTINVHIYTRNPGNGYGNTWCGTANFTRVPPNGTVNVNSNRPTSWTLTGPYGTYQGGPNATSQSYTVPYGDNYTVTPGSIPGYD